MYVETKSRARPEGASTSVLLRQPANPEKLLATGQVATLTGMSKSWLEKGRIYGWGPKYLRLSAGAIRYRWSDVLTYLQGRECNPEEVGQ